MASHTSYSAADAEARFNALPPDIKQIIYSIDMQEAVARIGRAHRLHIDQLNPLETEVAGAMLGFTEPQDFPRMLTERIGITPEEAVAVSRDIDAELFQKIRESMKKMATLNDVPTEEKGSLPPATQTPPPVRVVNTPETVQEKEQSTLLEIAPNNLPEVRPNVEPMDETLSSHTVAVPQKIQAGKLPNQSTSPKGAGMTEQEKKYAVDPYREPIEP